MPTLDWIGKDKVINHHMEVPYRVLDEKYSYGEESENMIIHGDNLSALKSLLPQYEGRIKCIYIVIWSPELYKNNMVTHSFPCLLSSYLLRNVKIAQREL